MKPTSKCCFSVPLCHLLPLHVVRHVWDVDVQWQENELVDGYHEGDMVRYVSLWIMQRKWRRSPKLPRNFGMNIGKSSIMFFELFLSTHNDLCGFKGKMFWMWEGNHRVSAWHRDIDHLLHNEVGDTSLPFIIYNSLGFVGIMLDSMHDVDMLRD